MRPRLALAALLTLAVLAAPQPAQAQAQADLPPVEVLTDVTGDAPLSVQGAETDQQRWPWADLKSLSLQEGNDTFLLTLGVAGFTRDPVEEQVGSAGLLASTYAYYTIELTVAERPYVLEMYNDLDNDFLYAYWCSREGSRFECYEELQVSVDEAAGTYTIRIPRADFVAKDGSSLAKGDLITGFSVMSDGSTTTGVARATDRMPDSGVGAISYTVQQGSVQAGTVLLESPAPVRVSNGEATTFLFKLDVKNTADHHDTLLLSAEGAPSDWVVTFPQEEVRVDPGASVEVAALVTVPFNHVHGLFKAFNVTATSRSDPLSFATQELGVRYTRVPQPAGHHDTVWLHDTDGYFFINALEQEEVPDDEATSSFGGSCGFSSPDGSGSSELIQLMPDLEMGIDTALERTGMARITVTTQTPIQGTSSVSGYFLVWDDEDDQYAEVCAWQQPETAFLAITRSEPITLDANQQMTLELPITPLPYGDRIDYSSGLHMGLLLIVWDEGTNAALPTNVGDLGGTGLAFVEGSSFQLPLDEYHDPVDEYFSSLSGIELYTDAEQQRLVNPGETVVFRLSAENIGLQPASFDLELTGSNLEWARILGDTRIAIGAGDVRELAVAIKAPAGTSTGEMADVTLHAVKADDDNVRSLIRLLATVDETEDHPDESDQVEGLDDDLQSKDSPGLAPIVGALAALAVALVVRRRPGGP